MQHSIRRSIRVAASSARPAFILACLGAASALAQAQQIMPNYRNADIRQIIEAVGEVTGRNFLIDPRVNADVTLLSFSPMSPEAFYEAFLATLQVHAFVAVESGELVKIVPDANARILPGADPGAAGDQIVTQVVTLDNVGAAQLVPILRPLVAQYGHLAAHPTSNSLIIADRAANVNRMLGILTRMDQGGEEDIEVIRLQNASATEVVTMLSALNQAAAAAGGAPAAQIAADNRTNSVLLSGPQNSRLRFRALIAHLDTPTENGGTTQVRYLNYANAEELATNLQTQFGGATAEGAPDAPPEGISIWADVGTNALIISADPRTMQDMNAVIDRLDIRRAQVQVDAIIVEMSETRANELGITWAIQGADGDPAGLTNFSSTPGIAQLGAAVSASETPNASVLPEGLLTAVGRIRDDGTSWAAVLTALAGDASTNIIATPTIVTLDNEQAEINVGQQVPFLTGQFTNTGAATGAVNPFQTIQREDVGTRLAITPQINEGSGVKLLIEQEQSSISRGVQGAGAVDLITNRRTITTSVFVEDGHILVLGGLIDDQLRSGEDRVPVLGRIPGIGALFRSQSTELVKVNLMVFIRPTILRDSIQAAFQTNAKYRYLRDLQLQQGERPVPLMNDEQPPTLPELPAGQPQAPPAPPE